MAGQWEKLARVIHLSILSTLTMSLVLVFDGSANCYFQFRKHSTELFEVIDFMNALFVNAYERSRNVPSEAAVNVDCWILISIELRKDEGDSDGKRMIGGESWLIISDIECTELKCGRFHFLFDLIYPMQSLKMGAMWWRFSWYSKLNSPFDNMQDVGNDMDIIFIWSVRC